VVCGLEFHHDARGAGSYDPSSWYDSQNPVAALSVAAGGWRKILRTDVVHCLGFPCPDGLRHRYWRKCLATADQPFAVDRLFLESQSHRNQYLFSVECGFSFHNVGASHNDCGSNNYLTADDNTSANVYRATNYPAATIDNAAANVYDDTNHVKTSDHARSDNIISTPGNYPTVVCYILCAHRPNIISVANNDSISRKSGDQFFDNSRSAHHHSRWNGVDECGCRIVDN